MSTAWLATLLSLPLLPSAGTGWLDSRYPYRVPVTVETGFHDRTDALARLPLDRDGWLARLGGRPSAVRDALRLLEVTPTGQLAAETPAALSADGQELRWVVAGRTEALSQRHYQLYLDVSASAPRLPAYPNPPPEAPAENLLLNPGFEEPAPTDPTQAASWAAHGAEGLTVERTSEAAHSGHCSLKVTNRKGGETAASADQVVQPLLPGKTYLVSGWVKITECETGSAVLTTWYSARAGEKAPGNYKTQTGAQGVFDWQRVESTGIIYYDAEHEAHVNPAVTLACTGGGRFEVACYYGVLTAYFDDLRLVECSRDVLAPVTAAVGPAEKR